MDFIVCQFYFIQDLHFWFCSFVCDWVSIFLGRIQKDWKPVNTEQEKSSFILERMVEWNYVWRKWKGKGLNNIMFPKTEHLSTGQIWLILI